MGTHLDQSVYNKLLLYQQALKLVYTVELLAKAYETSCNGSKGKSYELPLIILGTFAMTLHNGNCLTSTSILRLSSSWRSLNQSED